jgi:FtsP/CotA-like multicopper oxidase with cupredoxin domain
LTWTEILSLFLDEEEKMEKDSRVGIRSVRVHVLMLMILSIFAAGSSFGATIDVYLRADTFTKTMPDGVAITMWGYVLTDDTFSPLLGEVVKVPGPTLTATEGDTLNIHVRNNLTGLFTEPTSVIVPGQVPSLTPDTYPTWTDGTTGPRTSATQRVRSFTTETPVAGTGTYTFTPVRAGTYLYQSGTHPGVQVQMGLYGPLIVNPGIAGRAYSDASTAYDSQVILLLSEIDPELHYSIESGRYGTAPPAPPEPTLRGQRTSPEAYRPQYFLINGEPYSPSLSPIPAGSPNERLLIRFLNAGLLEKTPTLQNYVTVIAEDGSLYPYSKQQYSVLLPAGKTMDAILVLPAQAGYVPIFDRSLNLTNAAASPGGARAYFQVAAAAQFTLTVAKNGTGTGTVTAASLPGGIDCGLDCSEIFNSGTITRLVGTPDPGSLLMGWSGTGGWNFVGYGDLIGTVTANTTVTATFTAFNAISVLLPVKGEVIQAGSTTTIRWGAPANAVTFKLRYSLNNGTTWKTITSNVKGSTYPWSVPVPASTKTKCLVKVIGFNAKGARVGAANSGKFTISVP